MTERCCDCDLPLASQEDEQNTQPGEGHGLCWRAWHQDRCQMPPMNWQLRAIAAENLLRYVERWLRAGYARVVRDVEVAQLITEHLTPSHLAKMDGGDRYQRASPETIATELERAQDQALKERFRPPASTATPPGRVPSPRTPAPPSRARRRR